MCSASKNSCWGIDLPFVSSQFQYNRAAGVLTKLQKDTVCQKIVCKYLDFSMLFRGLGRPGALTLATPEIF